MKIEIIGSGSLGLLFGGMLAAAGEKVTFWTRTSGQAEMLRNNGIVLKGPEESVRTIAPDSFTANPVSEATEKAKQAWPDWILLTVKQRHIDTGLLNGVKARLGRETKIACFQNGVGHIERLKSFFAEHPVYAVITTEGAKRENESTVIRSGHGTTTIGIPRHTGVSNIEEKGVMAKEPEESLVNRLEKAGFESFLSNDIDREIYRKLLINAVINPLTALLRISNGELLEGPDRLELIRQLCDEGVRVYQACGIPYDPDMHDVIADVCRSTSANTSSMLKDVLQGSPTEVDYINGRLVEMARSVNLEVPGHETLWRLIKSLPTRCDDKGFLESPESR